jgi:hypothetical protein
MIFMNIFSPPSTHAATTCVATAGARDKALSMLAEVL